MCYRACKMGAWSRAFDVCRTFKIAWWMILVPSFSSPKRRFCFSAIFYLHNQTYCNKNIIFVHLISTSRWFHVHIAPSHLGILFFYFFTHFLLLNVMSSWIRLTNHAPNISASYVESTPTFYVSVIKVLFKFCNPLTLDGNTFSLSTSAKKKFWQIRNIERWSCML